MAANGEKCRSLLYKLFPSYSFEQQWNENKTQEKRKKE